MERKISNPTRSAKRRAHTWRSAESRERSARAGAANLAAYRASMTAEPAQKHGVVGFLQGGKVPQDITKKLDEFEEGLLSDLGNEPTTAQRLLVETVRVSLTVCLLASAYIRQEGLSKLRRSSWILATLATYLNSTRLALCAIGLERRTKDVLTLDSVIADIAQKRSQATTGESASPEVQPVEKAAGDLENHAAN